VILFLLQASTRTVLTKSLQALSRTLLGIPQDTEKEESSEQISFSSTGKAYATANLEGVHEMLVIDGYSEDDRATFKVRTIFVTKHILLLW
jgi:hypothetical protein